LTLALLERCCFSVRPASAGKERMAQLEGGACTLLGPEGPDAVASATSDRPSDRHEAIGLIAQCRDRPYVENYTVDASILELWTFSSRCSDQNYLVHLLVRCFR